jgi:hypothetical protein
VLIKVVFEADRVTGAGLSSDERAPRRGVALGPKVVRDPAQVNTKIRGSLDVRGRLGESGVIRQSC